MKFLVIQTASIGDVILATPVIEKLHRDFPDASIDFLLKKGNEGLFDNHPFLNKVYVWDKHAHKYINFVLVLREIRHARYDYVINIHRFFASGFLTVFSRAKTRVGFDKNPLSVFFDKREKHLIGNGNQHETKRNLSLIKSFTNKGNAPVKLYPSESDVENVSQYKTHDYITLAPASIWFTKQYPREKWVEFLAGIKENRRVYLLGSKNDSELCDWIIESSNYANAMNLSGKLTFLQTAQLMRDARMNFVNDSAPMHLASAVNAPITAIFCSTVPAFGFGPLSDDSHIVETSKILSCRPCGLHGYDACPEKHFDCAMTIDKNELLKRI